MNYIYNILVNFKYPLLDFYEWNRNDNIINIKKIPIIKVSKKVLNKLSKYHFKMLNINETINNKTITYDNRKLYACILSDKEKAVAFLFNNRGKCIGKSNLLLDEELEVLEIIKDEKEEIIKYALKNKDKIDYYKTSKEVKKRKYLINQINQIKDIDKMNYIYYDCFNKIDNNPKYRLLSTIDDNWDEISDKLYNFFHIK